MCGCPGDEKDRDNSWVNQDVLKEARKMPFRDWKIRHAFPDDANSLYYKAGHV